MQTLIPIRLKSSFYPKKVLTTTANPISRLIITGLSKKPILMFSIKERVIK